MRVLAACNQKGGVGKTFVACQLSFYTAGLGLPTLLLEFDHQGNASNSLRRGGHAVMAGFSMLDVFEGRWQALPDGPLVVVPAELGLSALERQPENHNRYVNALQQFLHEAASRFALCVMDTNPSPDVRYGAALVTADSLLSPIELNQEAIEGIGALLHRGRYSYQRVRERLNPRLELLGILPNKVEATLFQRANLQQLVRQYPGLLIPVQRGEDAGYAYVPTRTAVAEAQAAGVPLWQLRAAGPAQQEGRGPVAAPPLRSAAREAWREIRPSFEAIVARLGLEQGGGA